MRFPSRLLAALLALALCLLGACKDRGKVSADRSADHVTFLVALVEKDVAEVRSGLPEGAKKLEPVFAKDSPVRDNPVELKNKVSRMRHDTKGLFLAKSTFMVLVDEKGVALRNEIDPDGVAGKNLRASIPALEPVFQGQSLETRGAFAEFAGVKEAARDRVWLAASPVPVESGGSAALVTGWSYRLFARHLYESLRREVLEAARAEGTKEPLYYVGVFDESGVFMAPGIPQINEDALGKESLHQKTIGGPFRTSLTVTDRSFGYAAARTPAMGPDTGVVVLRSEI